MFLMRQPSPFERLMSEFARAVPESRLENPASCLGVSSRCDGVHGCPKPNNARTSMLGALRLPWIEAVNVRGFSPEEVEVKVEADAVIVHARREERQGDNVDILERRRVVKIPEGVDKDNVACFMAPDGNLLVRAPYIEPASTATKKPSSATETSSNSATSEQSKQGTDEMPKSDSIDNDSKKVEVTQEKQGTAPAKPEGELTDTRTATADPAATGSGDSTETEQKYTCEPEDEVLTSLQILFGESGEEEILPAQKDKSPQNDTQQEQSMGEQNSGAAASVGLNIPALKPLEASVRRTKDGLNERYEVSLNLKDFDTDSIAIRFVDNELCIEGTQEIKSYGIHTIREVHRKFAIPEDAILDSARAHVTSSGIVNVIVPLETRKEEPSKSIPIVQLK